MNCVKVDSYQLLSSKGYIFDFFRVLCLPFALSVRFWGSATLSHVITSAGLYLKQRCAILYVVPGCYENVTKFMIFACDQSSSQCIVGHRDMRSYMYLFDPCPYHILRHWAFPANAAFIPIQLHQVHELGDVV